MAADVGDDFDRILDQLATYQVANPGLSIREIICAASGNPAMQSEVANSSGTAMNTPLASGSPVLSGWFDVFRRPTRQSARRRTAGADSRTMTRPSAQALAGLQATRRTHTIGYSVLRRIAMRETLIVSSRGQVTLPAGMRKQLGIAPGSAVIIEDRDGELRLKPAAVLEIEAYSDTQIADWDREDALTTDERQRILARLQAA
ncbi:MAG: AbrB/MazE/SpoVT family DNA-binding domain-containing protein [Sulfuritalea sp.]|nr:AbrB/MazE/SpoVT family DNA-binding domain-containing protein [Sulfuritalea sp.]